VSLLIKKNINILKIKILKISNFKFLMGFGGWPPPLGREWPRATPSPIWEGLQATPEQVGSEPPLAYAATPMG